MVKRLLFLFIIIIFSCFLYFHISEIINDIKEENNQIFSIDVKPYKSTHECYQLGHPRDGVDCNTINYYTQEDEQVLKKQESLLGLFPLVKGLLKFVMIATSIWFIWSMYCSIDDFFENKRKKKLEKQQEQLQKQKELKDSQFIEEIITIIRKREDNGKPLSFKEVMKIRTKLDNHMDKVVSDKVEEIIKEHMKEFNPKWK